MILNQIATCFLTVIDGFYLFPAMFNAIQTPFDGDPTP
jgi:hypothetical protein